MTNGISVTVQHTYNVARLIAKLLVCFDHQWSDADTFFKILRSCDR